MEETPKYIEDAEGCRRTTEEFLQEFKEEVYPSYASFGLTFFEALSLWKLNTIYNNIDNIREILAQWEEDKKWK